ncbi:MAG: hypothetical protein R6X34_29140 [Chloroflexota bacterium]
MFTNIKAAGIMLVGLSLFFGIFIFSRFLDDGQNIGFWIGIFIGGGLGVLTCFLLIINLRSKNETKKTPAQFQLLPIAVIGGLLFAHFVLNIFTPEIEMLITNILMSWFIVTMLFIGLLILLKTNIKKS